MLKRKYINRKKKLIKQFFLYKKKLKLSKLWIKRFKIKKKTLYKVRKTKKHIKRIKTKKHIKRIKIIKEKHIRYVKIRKKYFVWVKKKKHKRLRHLNNFIFFFRKRKKRYPRLSLRWLSYRLRVKKEKPLNIERIFKNLTIPDFKRRFSGRLKNRVLKKRSFFLKLLNYYKLVNKKCFFYLKKNLKKKKIKMKGLIFFLEFRLAPVCVRFHFFWTITKAHFWINNGTIAVNNLQVITINFKLKLNDYIKILGPKKLWTKRLTTYNGVFFFHSKYNISLNYSVLCYSQKAGILINFPQTFSEIKILSKKRRKNWINLNFFLYLTNSFY